MVDAVLLLQENMVGPLCLIGSVLSWCELTLLTILKTTV